MGKKGFFITGTDTGVGKTVITAGLLGAFRRKGENAIAFKPIQSGAIIEGNRLVSEDARFYGAAANIPFEAMNCINLKTPVAPALAAEVEKVDIKVEELMSQYEDLHKNHDLVLVEGAGGLIVPLIGMDFTVADMAKLIGLPLIIVARPNLGTINHTCLTVNYAKSIGLEVAGVIISGYNPETEDLAEINNPRMIEKMAGVPVRGLVPRIKGLQVEGKQPNASYLVEAIEASVDLDKLLGILEEGEDIDE